MAKRSKKKKVVGREISATAAPRGARLDAGAAKQNASASGPEPSGKADSIASASMAPATIAIAPTSPACFRHDWLWGLILILAIFLTYQPVWFAGYIWDDNVYLTENRDMNGLQGLVQIWTTSAADISPLTFTTFWLEHALWGLAALPYHLVNVALHATCAFLLWHVLRNLRVPDPGAWLGAGLWAIHPVQVESVAWITETKNTQSGLFFLLSILFCVRWLKARDLDGRSGRWNYALTVLFAALAMASKSSTVILPVVMCLCAWWLEGRWNWRNVVRLNPIFLLSLVASALTIWTQGLHLSANTDPQWVRTWPERLITAGDAVWFHLGKLIWPQPLIAIYPRWQIDATRWISYLPLIAVIIISFILWLGRESSARPCFFVFAYFLVALLPVLGLLDNPIFEYSLVFDHFQYLASMGPAALVGVEIAHRTNFAGSARQWLQSTVGAGLLLVLGLLSWHRVWAFESDDSLWADTLTKNPDCWVGHNNLGVVLLQNGQADEAMAHYEKALEINPGYAEARTNLGKALLQQGQVDEARAQFEKALEIAPGDAEVYNEIGRALSKKGEVDEAIDQYQKALEIDPNLVAAYSNLGIAFAQKGRVDEAIGAYQKALEIDPGFANARYNLGNAFLRHGRLDEAIAQYEKILKTDPNNASTHGNLGVAFFQKGRVDEAIDEYEKALEINPNYVEAHNNLGCVYLQTGKLAEAIGQFQDAFKLNPADSDAQINLAKAQAMARKLSR